MNAFGSVAADVGHTLAVRWLAKRALTHHESEPS